MGKAIADKLSYRHKVFVVSKKSSTRLKSSSNLKLDSRLDRLSKSKVVIIAVKPVDIAIVAEQLKGLIGSGTILVSIAAGVDLKKLTGLFSHKKTVRCMPNLPLLADAGVVGWFAHGLSQEDKKTVRSLLGMVGEGIEVAQEKDIDVVTAVSGSGPAYFYYFCEGLAKGARDLGFSQSMADKLVRHTIIGAAAILKAEPNTSFDQLIVRIASKKGTTEAALKYFDTRKLKQVAAMGAKHAFLRAREISNGKFN